MPDAVSLLGLAAIAPLLMYAGYSDLRSLRIPNWISLAMLVVFAALVPFLAGPEIMMRGSVAGIVFVIGFVLFALNMLGAGDVKLLAALFLFVPSSHIQVFLIAFSPALLCGVALICAVRWRPHPRVAGWASVTTPGVFPMGISIAAAGLMIGPLIVLTQ